MELSKVIFLIFCFVTFGVFAQSNNSDVFDCFDYSQLQLKAISDAHKKGDKVEALKELMIHFQTKDNLYLKVTKRDIAYIKSTYKEDVENSINVADQVLDQYFLFRNDWDMEKTNIPHQFKGEIDWKAMPNGDFEWCYMLNRHKFWVDLGKAYFLTGKEKYAKAFVDQVTHWVAENPLGDNLKNYTWRRIEAGIRCENWIKAYEYLKGSKYITPEFMALFIRSLHQHGEYINSSFSNFSQTSNWGVIEYNGLFTLACYFTEFKEASQWQQDAINKLNTCINLQILDDGSQWEQSPMYHNEVFHCYLNIKKSAQCRHIELPQGMVQKIKDMAYANIKWQKPNYHQPLLGDSDDTNLRGILTTAAHLFKDPVIKSRAFKKLDYETFLSAGIKQAKEYTGLAVKEPDFLSVYQKGSGDFYMRDTWQENATYTGFHLKKLGCGHGHDNILHFTIYANHRDYLVDGGRYTYVNNEWRDLFKSNISHNTLGVDHLPNSVYANSWVNKYEARSQGIYTNISTTFDYGEAENTAYKRLEDPVSMKRRLLFLKPNIWLVFDSFQGKEVHTYSQYFNFPNKKVDVVDGGLTTTYKDNNLRIQPVKTVDIKLTEAWWSPEYNLKQETVRAEVYLKNKGFTSFISLLYFPDQTELEYEQIPVYNRNEKLLSDNYAEAVKISLDNKEYILMVVHDSPAPATHFFKVDNQFVQGEVVLIEKSEGKSIIHLIKE